ncbi:MAG: hypothetical protein KDI02_16515, partial [Anaerolineae bacterium]|nr:hypothetical protein [Anaerolineae bacterium]
MAAATQKAASPTTDLDRRERSPLGDAFRQLLKNKVAVASGIFIILLIFLAIFADYFNAYALQGF